ncbi:MAG: YncE family protein [Planctomycetota bacterium]
MIRSLLLTLSLTALATTAATQQVVVANRGSADITVIDTARLTVTRTVPLPPGAATPEPMYVVAAAGEVLVGDRANNRIVRFDRRTYRVLGTVAVGTGVFHMWASDRQLWVNNDVDNTSSVIDLATMTVMATVSMPADLMVQGYKPHDVFVTGRNAYVSLLGAGLSTDFVVQFSTRTFTETARAAVGRDPHLWWDHRSNRLYVPCQNSDTVFVLDGDSLAELQQVAVPGAHGVYVPAGTGRLLVSNFPSGSDNGLYELSTGPTVRVRRAVGVPVPSPHNIAAVPGGRRIFVTHSSASRTEVSAYQRVGLGQPVLRRVIQAGTNPFGLAYVP